MASASHAQVPHTLAESDQQDLRPRKRDVGLLRRIFMLLDKGRKGSKVNFRPHSQAENNPFARPRGDSRPVDKLPVELLACVFEFGAAHNDNPLDELRSSLKYKGLEHAAGEGREQASKRCTGDGPPFQVTASHVCRRWRNVAIATASLWSDIRIPGKVSGMRALCKCVSVHLERSKRHPIDITVDGYGANSERVFSDVKSLYDLLIPHVCRWRSIELKGVSSRHMSVFLEAISNPSTASAPQLTALRLHHFRGTEVSVQDPTRRDFPIFFNGSAPRLKHLVLSRIPVSWTQIWVSAASNLTTLELLSLPRHNQPSWTEFATILHGAPALRKLVLDSSGPTGSPLEWETDFNPPIQLLHLSELVFGLQPEAVVIALLRKLYVPILKVLILGLGYYDDYGNFVDVLTGPATTSTPFLADEPPCTLLSRLERLAILNLPCQHKDRMITMFDCLQNLKVLRISLSDISSESDPFQLPIFLQLLLPITSPSERGVMCRLPRLESLFLCPAAGNLSLLREVVQRRMDAGFPLKSLYLSFDEDMDDEDQAWFLERLEVFGYVDRVHCSDTDRAFEAE